jgi:hypothetical protein
MYSLLDDVHGSKIAQIEELQLVDGRNKTQTTKPDEVASNVRDSEGSVDKMIFI